MKTWAFFVNRHQITVVIFFFLFFFFFCPERVKNDAKERRERKDRKKDYATFCFYIKEAC